MKTLYEQIRLTGSDVGFTAKEILATVDAKLLHLRDVYDSLGVKWGDDPFHAIAALKALGAPPDAEAAPPHEHHFAYYEICRRCGLTDAAIAGCHHCDDDGNEKAGRCWWCLKPRAQRVADSAVFPPMERRQNVRPRDLSSSSVPDFVDVDLPRAERPERGAASRDLGCCPRCIGRTVGPDERGAAPSRSTPAPQTPIGELIAKADELCGELFDCEVRLIPTTRWEKEAGEVIRQLLILVEPAALPAVEAMPPQRAKPTEIIAALHALREDIGGKRDEANWLPRLEVEINALSGFSQSAAVPLGAADAVPREPQAPQVTAEHGLYWLYRLQDAFAAIETQGICRCDLDCLAPSEDETLGRFLGVLQDFAHGYSEYDDEQPRLSALFMQVLRAESDRHFGPVAAPAPGAAEAREPQTPLIVKHIADFCEQVNRDGIMPSRAWFMETATLLRELDWVAPAASRDSPPPADELRALAAELRAIPHYAFDQHGVIYGPVDPGPCTFVRNEDFEALADRLALLAGKEPT